MFEPAPTFNIDEAGVLTFIVMLWVFCADDAAIFPNCTWPKWGLGFRGCKRTDLGDVGFSLAWPSSRN